MVKGDQSPRVRRFVLTARVLTHVIVSCALTITRETMNAVRRPETEAEFREQMATVIRRAEDNGVNVEGGYQFRTTKDRPDWSMEIVRLSKPNST